jgi:lipopolysaccharide transport system permease protein
VLWIIDGLAAGLLLGAFCARFRDIPPIVASVMQIAFFLSAIIWKPEQIGAAARWLPLNPFFSLLDIARAPLLGGVAPAGVWIGALGYSAALCVLAWLLFSRVRGRLAFWV